MLELKLVKDCLFLNILESILDLVDVASVDCSSTGLKLQAVDNEHFAIVLFFPAKEFPKYYCDEYISTGIPIDDMLKAIHCADKDDTITFKVGYENIETFTLSFESPKKNTDLDLQFTSVDHYQIPEWEAVDSKYEAVVQMPFPEFKCFCKRFSNIGGNGQISVTEKGLQFLASGENVRLNIKYTQPEVVTMRAPVSMTLDLKYMNSLAKVSSLFDQVKICLSTTEPLIVEYKIKEMGYIRYFLVPNVETVMEEEEIEKIKRS